MTKLIIITIITVSFALFFGQILVGTTIYTASFFSIAILFGLLAIVEGGGLFSAVGALNAVLLTKFLLIGVILKILFLQPADSHLLAPEVTSLVSALGFAGLLVGTILLHRMPRLHIPLMPRLRSYREFLVLTILWTVGGCAAYFIAMAPQFAGEGVQTGGILGIASTVSTLKSLAVVPAMLCVWLGGSKRYMTHRLVLCVLCISVLIGTFTTNKQDAMEPLFFYLVLGFLRYGFKDKRLWITTCAGVAYFMLIVYPYSQFVRGAGGRVGGISERLEAIGYVYWNVMSNSDFRNTVTQGIALRQSDAYLGAGILGPFNRLAMVGEADRLIAATDAQQNFTGWETITWGFKLMAPSFLFPDKPVYATGNYLGHYSGQLSEGDKTTQISYGVIANFYNAFSYSGTFLGCAIFFFLFYSILTLFFHRPVWSGRPDSSTLGYLCIFASFQHSIVEGTVASLIPSLWIPAVMTATLFLAKAMTPLDMRA